MTRYRTYDEYLKTPEFRAVRAQVMLRSGGQCENCPDGVERCDRSAVDPHHVAYCQWGDFDPPDHLLAVCRECHEALHTCEDCGGMFGAETIKAGRTVCFDCYCAAEDD